MCRMNGVGKPTALSAMDKKDLALLGNLDAKIEDIVEEATEFIGICYTISKGKNMSEKRYESFFGPPHQRYEPINSVIPLVRNTLFFRIGSFFLFFFMKVGHYINWNRCILSCGMWYLECR